MNYKESLPKNISYSAHLSSDSSVFNNDLRIHSIELSSTRTCNPGNLIQTPLSSIDIPMGNSTYITRNSPKIVTTVSETYLPLETPGSSIQISSNVPITYPTSDISTLSFEKHFLWNTSLFCSQTLPMNERLLNHSKLNNIFNWKNHKNFPVESNVISDFDIDNKKISDQKSHEPPEMRGTPYNSNCNEDTSSSSLAFKRNPYSIDEILKKPVKKIRYTDSFDFNQKQVGHRDDTQGSLKSTDVNSGTTDCSDKTSESSLLNKRSRIRLKVYDISV